VSAPQIPATADVTMIVDLLDFESVAFCVPSTLERVESTPARELRKPGLGVV